MLAGVLLHVIEAPRPVDAATNDLPGFGVQGSRFRVRSGFGVRGSGFDDVRNRSILFVHDIDDAKRTELAGVERLPSGCRIERRSVERDEDAIVATIDARDGRVKRF